MLRIYNTKCVQRSGPVSMNMCANSPLNRIYLLNGDNNEKIGMCGAQVGLFSRPKSVKKCSLSTIPETRTGFMDSLADRD